MKTGSGFAAGSPNNLLIKSWIWRKPSYFSPVLEAAEVVDHEQGRNGRLEILDRVRAHQQWYSRRRRWRLLQRSKAGRRRQTAASSGRRAAVLFPPGHVATWEAVQLPAERHSRPQWHPRRPKWLRPRRRRGDSGSETVDLIAFLIFSSGSFLQSPRTWLYLLVILGPSVKCVVLALSE